MANTAKFYIRRQINNQYYYTLISANNETILTGEGYSSKQNCLNGINSVKINALFDIRYDRKTTWTGSQYYFTLKASNGEPIGVSEMYNTLTARENGVSAIKRDAPNGLIVDLS